VSQVDPGKAALRNAVMSVAPEWNENPLWSQMKLTGGFQLLTEVSDALLRKVTINSEQYDFMKQVGVQSIMVQPVVSRGQTVAIFNLMYTTESGRRYGRGDPELAAEMALHAAHIIENARLLRDLRASEARFRASMAGTRTVIFEQDTSLRYTWAYNPLVAVPLVGRRDADIFSAEDAAVLTALKRQAMESGGSARRDVELTLEGDRRTYREWIEARRDRSGKVMGILGSATDITDEKRAERQLGEAIAFRDRVMGVLGHDLRNPLSAAKLGASTLRRENLPDAVLGKIAVIERATNRMTELIATLLDFARVQGQRRLPINRVPTDLGALVKDVAGELATGSPDRAIEVDVRGEQQGQWDPARVEQALSNLVGNALEHSPPRTPVHLLVEGSGEAVVVKIKNEGPPIPSELRPFLFEPFARGETSPHGLGLGLFIVREVAVAHGGTIDVDSSAEKGTVFTLVLPRAA
jgi:signal transduction histidine kinase